MRLIRLIAACLATGLLAVAFNPIGMGQAKSTPKTVAQCKKQFKHNAKARKACIKRLRHKKVTKPTSGCTLQTTWFQGDTGDKQDFDVTLKVTGQSPGPFPTYVEVTVHNPKVEICSATITGIEVGAGGSIHKSWPVTIGSHGGVSSRVSLPGTVEAPGATVLGRLK